MYIMLYTNAIKCAFLEIVIMRTNNYLLATLKESPTDTEAVSQKLMIRAGMIRKLASGIYTWLPTGQRILRKMIDIIRDEMNNAGAIEIAMPIVQPADLWQESSRLIQYGPELLRFTDRNNRPFVLGPTHEEVITHLIRNEVSSYKELPINLFQIQTKFRDEVRPRFGVMRSREFLMKDSYSFHSSEDSLQLTYEAMYQAYSIIFSRIKLDFCAVKADSGSIGGNISHEFHVIAKSGENEIVCSDNHHYSANIEIAEALPVPNTILPAPKEKMRLVDATNSNNITELVKQFNLSVKNTVKILIVRASKTSKHQLVALMLRGDHHINKLKVEKLSQIAVPLTFATKEEIGLTIVTDSNFLGPVNLPIPLVVDRSAAIMSDFTAGANIKGKYYFGINWGRDLPLPEIVADLRKVVDSEPSPHGDGTLRIKRGIEVGHIFQLGKKYSKAMKAMVHAEDGHKHPMYMGCYGIGVTRLLAAAIEQNYDNRGIIWSEALAPFNVAILPINMHKSSLVQNVAEEIYFVLRKRAIDVLLDDRKESPGVMFSDIELIGIPHTIILGEYNLHFKNVEYKNRRTREKKIIKLDLIVDFITEQIVSSY